LALHPNKDQSMKISDVMTAEPRSAQAGDSLQSVAQQMKQGDFGSMPVLDDGRLAGVVTDRDIAVRGVAQGLAASEPVSKVMTPDPVCVTSDCDLQEAAQLMQDRQIRRLYVTDNEALVGVVALADVVDVANDRLSGETIEKISQQ
jgi:CBS domain-containing protein